ncbi:MAG: matrixin family metalloprotease [Candidatus Obscuribacterales bacterium]
MDNIEKEIKTDKPESESPPAPVPESIEPEPNETEPEPDEPGSADIPDKLKEETEPPEPKSPGADGYLALVDENGLARWPQDRMPVKIYIDQKSDLPHFKEEFPGMLQNAFKKWQDVCPDILNIEFVQEKDQATIVCTWTEDRDQMMSLKEGGNTMVIPDEDGILSVDMKILTLPPPGNSVIPFNYMERVCLHEAGHALGLTGHSDQESDIMFGTVYPDQRASELTERDRDTLSALYHLDRRTLMASRLDPAKEADQKALSSSNPKVKALAMSNMAVRALTDKQFDRAAKLLEDAHKLDPTNKLIAKNLGGVYANYGSIAAMTFNLPGACMYFKKSLPLLSLSGDREAQVQVLSNYVKVLRMLNQKAELEKMEKKLAELSK